MNTSMSKIKILSAFKAGITKFIDELVEQLPEEEDMVVLRILFHDQLPTEDVMNHYIEIVLPVKHMIDNKDEDFFITNIDIFGTVDTTKVNHFKKLWMSGKLDKDDKLTIWKWFTYLNKCAERYQKLSVK